MPNPKPEYRDGTENSTTRTEIHSSHTQEHNASLQHGVRPNPDPLLLRSNEHHHQPLHHTAKVGRMEEGDVMYAEEKTLETGGNPAQQTTHHGHGHSAGAGMDIKHGGEVQVMDAEKGTFSGEDSSEEDPRRHRLSRAYRMYKPAVHAFILALFTGWWIASLILHRNDKNWVIPFLLWLAVAIRIVTFYVPASLVMRPVRTIWKHTAVRVVVMIPESMRLPLGALGAIAVILIGAFASPESADNSRPNRAISLFGLLVFIGALYLTSRNRAMVKWHTVIVGMLTQFIIALFVLRTGVGFDIFNFISGLATDLLGFANDGTSFLTATSVVDLHWFLTGVIPAILFFVAFVQLLYYWGVLQWFILKFAVFFFWALRVSGAEAVVAAASPFIGQGESAMLIKPFVAHLTQAELHQVMCSGFATIAGSVLVAYISLGVNAQALVSSCVMSIPASLAISKLRYPEEEETLTAGRVVIPEGDGDRPANSLHAFANGAWLGLKIAGMILATLLCIIALLGLANGLLGWWGHYLNINDPPLSVELIVGYICYPIAFLLGVPRNDDLFKVSQLIGIKLIANEFVAYTALQQDPAYANLSLRSRLIATYALCGFANIGSLGTQIGVLSQIAPARAADVSRLALSALIAGALSTLTSASIAGLLVTDQAAYIKPIVNATMSG